MTKNEAKTYLFYTSWHELIQRETGKPIPEHIERKRKQAYERLRQAQ